MKVSIYPDYNTMSAAAADLIAEAIRRKPSAMVCLPSGESPTGIFRILVRYASEGKVNFSDVRFVGLDEWVGMDGRQEGSCRHYMDEHLFRPLAIKPGQIRFFDALSPDLDEECKKMDDHISRQGPIDIMMVGLGMNGHIGLNEPGADPGSYSHHTPLDPLTVQVAQKYFQQETRLQRGITLGLRHFREAATPILIAAGNKKAAIVALALEGEITKQVPASIIRSMAAGMVFLDREAASQLASPAAGQGSARETDPFPSNGQSA
jgi:glucosamine-6-phosphate isomerase